MSIWDFFTPEAGQQRRQWLDGQANGLLEYVPPEMRPWLGVANELNPITSMERAGQGARRVADPSLSGWERMAALGDTTSNMAGFVAPMVAASKGAVPAANAVEDALMGWSQGVGVPQFVGDESGALRVFHGSPHDFDKFSMDKIGTGEGAQAYGHGLYFADNEAVAKGYRDNLSLPTGTTAKDTAARILQENGGDYDAALSDAGTRFNRALSSDKLEPAEYDRWMKTQRMLLNRDPVLGRMYEVQIDAKPEDFLDWDAPLSAQPANVLAAITKKYPDAVERMGNRSGGEFYQYYLGGATAPSDAARASVDLADDAGIPGIRYLDAGSRGAEAVNELRGTVSMWDRAVAKTPNDPYAVQALNDAKAQLAEAEKSLSRNYVVFDENLISIVRKYGIAGAAAFYGATSADVQAAMAQEKQPTGLLGR